MLVDTAGTAGAPKRDLEGETKGQRYLRQMLGSSNIDAGPVWRS